MKKKYIVVSAVVAPILLIGFLGWYLLWPAASDAQLEAEMARIQDTSMIVTAQKHADTNELCYGSCSALLTSGEIPPESNYAALYDRYKQNLEQDGYRLQTTQNQFTSPTNFDGSPNTQYLAIYARSSMKYDVGIFFDNYEKRQAGTEAVPIVNFVTYDLSARKF